MDFFIWSKTRLPIYSTLHCVTVYCFNISYFGVFQMKYIQFSSEVQTIAWNCVGLCFSVNDATLPDDHVDQYGNDADGQQGENEDNPWWGIWESVLFSDTRAEVLVMDFHKHLLHNGVWVVTMCQPSPNLHAGGQIIVITKRAQGQRYRSLIRQQEEMSVSNNALVVFMWKHSFQK